MLRPGAVWSRAFFCALLLCERDGTIVIRPKILLPSVLKMSARTPYRSMASKTGGLVACVLAFVGCSGLAQSEHAANPLPCVSATKPAGQNAASFLFNYTGEWLGNFSGGYKRGGVYDGIVKPGLQLDLEKLLHWKGATFLATGLYPHGASITQKYVRDFNGISNIDAYDSPRLMELWLEQAFAQGQGSVRIGQMLADSEFCVSNGACLFINSAFGAIPLLSMNVEAPVYPVAAPGIRVKITPGEALFGQFAAFEGSSGDPAFDNRHGTRFFQHSRGALLIGEIGRVFNPPPKPAANKDNTTKPVRPLSATLVLGGFYNSASFEDLLGGERHSGEYAFYVMADQELWHEPWDANQGLRVFGRLGAAPSDRSAVAFYLDGGFNCQGLLPGRNEDVCGMGVSYSKLSPHFSDEADKAAESHHEAILEATYQMALPGGISLQPDLQYVFNPGGSGTQKNAVVAGMRLSMTF